VHLFLLFSATLLVFPASHAAESIGLARGQETGFSIPRFVSLGVERARMRIGPGTEYVIKWVYRKQGLPLEIVVEFGNWRKVRDHTGAEGWMHHALLSGKRTGIVAPWSDVLVPLRTVSSFDAPLVARLEPGVVVALESCGGSWCRVSVPAEGDRIVGHIRQAEIWGAYPGEIIE
jgi:SH3-like domain-containing protein